MEAMQVVKYEGYVSPGVLLLTGDPCSMEVIRGAWCRNVLRPPNSYVITKVGKCPLFACTPFRCRTRRTIRFTDVGDVAFLGDVEDCVVEDLNQGQFTPLSEALCLVILELTSANQNATIDTVRSALKIFFSNIQPPSEHIIYDAMVSLMTDNKVIKCIFFIFICPQFQLITVEKKKKILKFLYHFEAVAIFLQNQDTISLRLKYNFRVTIFVGHRELSINIVFSDIFFILKFNIL